MNMKKLISLALALVLMLAMAVPAFAADNGKITINKAVIGQTYSIYKIFDLESYDVDSKAYSYTIASNSPWYDFVTTGAGKDYIKVDVTTAGNYVTWIDGADPAEFAKLALEYAKAEGSGVTAVASQEATIVPVVFENLPLGYYLVDSTLGILCGLTTTKPEAEVDEKNEAPTIDKEVQEDSNEEWGDVNDGDIGQTVNYRTTITAQAGAQNYVFHDKMENGLTFDGVNSVSVTLKGNTVAAEGNYEVVAGAIEGCTEGCTFHVVFTKAFCDALKPNDEIVISYSATINENAVVAGAGNDNDSMLSYGDDNETTWDKTTTYTWDMDVVKYTKVNGEEVVLSGAKFTLSKNEDGSNPIKFTKTAENVYRVDPNGEITEIETDATGTFKIKGLDADTYYLTETQAPAGYNKLTGPQMVVIEATEGTDSVTELPTLEYTTVEAKVENKTGSELPSTGGMGTTLFYAMGSLMVAAAVVLLVVKRRMNAAE